MKTTIIFLSVVLWIFPLLAQEGEKEWNFDRDQVGLLARGFVNELGEWKIVGDSTAPSEPHVLAQAAKN